MTINYEKNKVHIYNWTEKNREKWNELSRAKMKRYYERNKEEKKQKCLSRYYYNKECQIFRNIDAF